MDASVMNDLEDCASPQKQIDILNEVCTMLCIGMEDYIRSFNLNMYLPAFINIVSTSKDQEVLVLTCRAIALILDIVPHSCTTVVSRGTVPRLSNLLKQQQTADNTVPTSPSEQQMTTSTNPLIEEILKSMDKISIQEPNVLLVDSTSVLSTILVQYESYSEPLRLKALDIVANVARKCSCSTSSSPTSTGSGTTVNFDNVVVHVPQLAKMILHVNSDSEIDKVCTIFAHLVDKCNQSRSLSHFQQLIGVHNTSSKSVENRTTIWEPLLMRLHKATTRQTTKSIIMKVLVSFAKFNAEYAGGDFELCRQLTHCGIAQVLKVLLSPQEQMLTSVSASSGSDNLLSKSNQLLLDVCYLLFLLCPPVSSLDVVRFSMEPQHEWKWEDDFHNFYPYDSNISNQLEKAYEQGLPEVTIQVLGNNYRIDLIGMKQYNVSSRLMRNVSRCPIASSYKKRKASSKINSPSSPSSPSHEDDQKKKKGGLFSRVFKKQKTSESSPTLASNSSADFVQSSSSDSLTLPDDYINNLSKPLMQLASTSANTSITESAVVSLTQIICNTNPEMIMRSDNLKASLTKYIHRILRRNRTNAVVVTHTIYLAQKLLASDLQYGSSSSSIPLTNLFIRENMLKEIKQTNCDIAKQFVDSYGATLSEEQGSNQTLTLLNEFCASLSQVSSEESSTNFSVLNQIFGDLHGVNGISIDQFISSKFATHLWSFMCRFKNDANKLHQIISSLAILFNDNQSTFSNLVDALSSSLELLDVLPSVASVSDQQELDDDDEVTHVNFTLNDSNTASTPDVRLPGFSSTSDLELLAASKISLQFKLKDRYDPVLSDLTENIYTISPLASMRAVEQFIVNKCVSHPQKRKVARLDLFIDDQFLENPYSLTLYECIRRYAKSNNYGYSEAFDGSSSYTISYTNKKNNNVRYPSSRCFTSQSIDVQSLQDYYLSERELAPLANGKKVNALFVHTLCVMRVFNALNRDWSLYVNSSRSTSETLIPSEHFISSQITSKLTQQMISPMSLALCCAGQLPSWDMITATHCSFLYPFNVRRMFFNFVVSGAQRTIMTQYAPQQYLHVNHSINDEENRDSDNMIRKHAQRIKIKDRNNILIEARKELAEQGMNKTVLEFEYEGEPGTGLGPTIQFYTSCCQELQSKELSIWYDNPNSSYSMGDEDLNKKEQLYIHSVAGLFPSLFESTLSAGDRMKKLSWFTMAGRMIAKSLEDGRLCDIELSRPWLELLLGKKKLQLPDYNDIDPFIVRSLKPMISLLDRYTTCNKSDQTMYNKLCAEIDNMMLTMNFKGVNLVDNGDDIDVTHDNFDRFLTLLQQLLLVDGFSEQLNAFCNGFHEIVNMNYLNMFSAPELSQLISGNDQLWTSREQVVENITTSHGYTMDSLPVQYLINVVSQMTPEDQKLFLEFSTGTSRLPVGGALSPKLTISRKVLEQDSKRRISDDDVLVTCNTCFHLIKLPNYSSEEVLRKKLLLSIRHGRGAFELS